MKIAIPMAGAGKRFVDAGYTIPKPLLPFRGKPLVYWAVESTRLLNGSYEYFPNELVAKHSLDVPPGCWHIVTTPTSGPLETLFTGKSCLDTNDELLIMDCDSVIDPIELSACTNVFRKIGCAGGVTLRKTQDPNCSYAIIDNEWWVMETREKDPFSPWSTTGPYWFASGKVFLDAAEKALHAHHTSVSPLYNYLPRSAKVKAIPIASFHHFGTPREYEQLTRYV